MINIKQKYLCLSMHKSGEIKLRADLTNHTYEIYRGELQDFYEILTHYKNLYPNSWIDSKIFGKHGYLMKVEDWKECCESGSFIDYDGHGDVLDENYNTIGFTKPSKRKQIPETGKYILWYNR